MARNRGENSPKVAATNRLAGYLFPAAAGNALRLQTASVVVALDGSRAAEHALPTALAVASRLDMDVRLVQVLDLFDAAYDPVQFLGDGARRYRMEQLRAGFAYLAGVKRRIRRMHGLDAAQRLVEDNDTAGALCRELRSGDLLVLAAWRSGWWNRCFGGNLAQEVARRVKSPLLLVPGYDAPADLSGDPIPAEVLVALDGSRRAEAVVKPAAALARSCGAQLTLLHVHPGYPSDGLESPMHYLEDVARTLPAGQRTRTMLIQSHGRPVARVIRQHIEQVEGGMLALTGRPGDPVMRLLQPKVVDAAVARLAGPILLHPGEPSTAGVCPL